MSCLHIQDNVTEHSYLSYHIMIVLDTLSHYIYFKLTFIFCYWSQLTFMDALLRRLGLVTASSHLIGVRLCHKILKQ